MWLKHVPLAPLLGPAGDPGQVEGELVNRHPHHVRQAVGLALAHVPRDQGVVALEELFECCRRGNIALNSGTFHLQLHLNNAFSTTMHNAEVEKTGLKVVNFDESFLHQFSTKIHQWCKKIQKIKKLLISQISLKKDFLNRKKPVWGVVTRKGWCQNKRIEKLEIF